MAPTSRPVTAQSERRPDGLPFGSPSKASVLRLRECDSLLVERTLGQTKFKLSGRVVTSWGQSSDLRTLAHHLSTPSIMTAPGRSCNPFRVWKLVVLVEHRAGRHGSLALGSCRRYAALRITSRMTLALSRWPFRLVMPRRSSSAPILR